MATLSADTSSAVMNPPALSQNQETKLERPLPTPPCTTDVDPMTLEPTSPTQEQQPATDAPPTAPQAEFLLVDDNQINLMILTSYIRKIGRPFSTAATGLDAVRTFCESPGRYKCVLMDISMPVMDGFEATRRIRAYEREQGLPPAAVFALSGLATASAQQEAFECGIDLFLAKPVRLKELDTILEDRGLL